MKNLILGLVIGFIIGDRIIEKRKYKRGTIINTNIDELFPLTSPNTGRVDKD